MKQLEGVELASFQARATALVIDFALASIVFVGALVALFIALNKIPIIARNDRHITIELDFFHNWYSIIYLVLFMGLTLYVGKGRTIGKRVMRIRVVSVAHPRLSLWHCLDERLATVLLHSNLGLAFCSISRTRIIRRFTIVSPKQSSSATCTLDELSDRPSPW